MAIRLPHHRLQATLLAAALFLATALGAGAALHSHAQLRSEQAAILLLHRQTADARLLLLLAEAQSAMRHWLLSGRLDDRDSAIRSGEALRDQGREVVQRLAGPLAARGLAPLGPPLEQVLQVREHAQDLFELNGNNAAPQAVLRSEAQLVVDRIRGVLEELRHKAQAEMAMREAKLQEGQLLGQMTIGGSAVATLLLLLGAIAMLARRRSAAEQASEAMDARGREVATLFRMGELLQSSLSPEDIRRVVSHTARELLPELGGAFYTFNNSRDRLDLLGAWGAGEAAAVATLPEYFGPNECWALKRGRPHGCGLSGGLLCDHATSSGTCGLCVPMHARGEVYGVLKFIPPVGTEVPSPARRELAYALADGVSLALANLALREKLRNQAMRDELTGLQNRRFLEEMLPRLVAHAERRGASIAVLMMDLDHFKQVNDRYGHATGDAVLREVGALLLARLRRMDMACRYGGEELLVLMPDCSATEALLRAQEICAQVRALNARADSTLPPVTVSIGVAAWPEHGEQMGKVIEAADAALYAAKRAGRDRSMSAEATVEKLALTAAAA